MVGQKTLKNKNIWGDMFEANTFFKCHFESIVNKKWILNNKLRKKRWFKEVKKYIANGNFQIAAHA